MKAVVVLGRLDLFICDTKFSAVFILLILLQFDFCYCVRCNTSAHVWRGKKKSRDVFSWLFRATLFIKCIFVHSARTQSANRNENKIVCLEFQRWQRNVEMILDLHCFKNLIFEQAHVYTQMCAAMKLQKLACAFAKADGWENGCDKCCLLTFEHIFCSEHKYVRKIY